MPLTDFLKSFLQQLPANMQYLGTSVAPLMDPQRWQQNQQEMMARAQQAQQFQQRQAMEQQQQNELERWRQNEATIGLIKAGAIPGQPPQAPGGAGLNAGGAESSFGAGGGRQGAATAQQVVPPTQPNNLGVFGMDWLQNLGQQQTGGQLSNAPGNQPGAVGPGNRMAGMTGDSGGGGAIVPAAQPSPSAAGPATVFNILGKGGQQQPYYIPGTPAEKSYNLDPAVAKVLGVDKLPESSYKAMAPVIDTIMREQAAKVKAPVKKDEKQYAIENAVDSVMQGVDPKWKRDPNQDPIDQLPSLEAKQAALAAAQRTLGNDPEDKLQARKLENRKLDLQEKDLQDKEADWNTNHSPAILANMAESVRRNPNSYFNISEKNRDEVGREFTRQTGMPPPSKIDTQTAAAENTGIKVQGYINNIQEILAARPNLLSKFGPISGRLSVAALEAGDIPGFTKAEKEDFGRLYGNIKNMNLSEVKTLLQGRPAMGLVNQLLGAYVSPSKVPELIIGALKASQDVVDDARQTAEIARFGSIPKWTAAELGSKFRVGQHVYNKGVLSTVLGFDANGKVQLYP